MLLQPHAETTAKQLKQRLLSPLSQELAVAVAVAMGLAGLFILTPVGDWATNYIHRFKDYRLEEIVLVLAASAVGAFIFALRRLYDLSQEVRRRVEAEEEFAQQALHDSLTGLPNRRLFEDRLSKALARARRNGEIVAVFMLDLDRFKPVNDLHGHKAGDILLQTVAERLGDLLREQDSLARFGGDEFAIIQIGSTQPLGAMRLGRRLVAAMEEPFHLGKVTVTVGLSAGIALYPTDADSPAELLRRADVALFRTKENGRAGYCFFEEHMDDHLQERAILERDLRQAIAEGDIDVLYQPVVDLSSGIITGFEALARWMHPERGLITPEIFIPVAEDCGQIVPLGEIVLRRACRDALNWPAEMSLSVNVSPLQFRSSTLADDILCILEQEDFPSHRLEIEITENAIFEDPTLAAKIIDTLKSAEVQLALDDFGTGYSSLAHLRDFPFDKVKIDRSFIGALHGHGEGAAIVRAIIAMCQSLGLPTIAEGIEEEIHRIALVNQGCTFGQGFLFGKPISNLEIAELLGGWNSFAASRSSIA